MMLMMLTTCLTIVEAQSAKEERAKLREERRQEQARLDSLFYLQSVKAIEEKSFVLEADRVIFKRGQTAYVSSNTNFVALDGDKATVQIAFNIPVSGPNGIGGITVDGTVSGYEQNGVGISARVDITLPRNSQNASVTILPNFNSNRLTLDGHILPLHLSNIYKGTAL